MPSARERPPCSASLSGVGCSLGHISPALSLQPGPQIDSYPLPSPYPSLTPVPGHPCIWGIPLLAEPPSPGTLRAGASADLPVGSCLSRETDFLQLCSCPLISPPRAAHLTPWPRQAGAIDSILPGLSAQAGAGHAGQPCPTQAGRQLWAAASHPSGAPRVKLSCIQGHAPARNYTFIGTRCCRRLNWDWELYFRAHPNYSRRDKARCRAAPALH